MSFKSLAALSRKHAARVMGGDLKAWFPATATTAPSARADYSTQVPDVLQGAARRQQGDLIGQVAGIDRTFPVSIPSGVLSYDPVEGETVFLIGTTKATATLCRVVTVRAAGGLIELECKQEVQTLT